MSVPFSLPIKDIRKLLNKYIVDDDDLMAFALDHFPSIEKRFSSGMTRIAKVNLLLKHGDPEKLVNSLIEFIRDNIPDKVQFLEIDAKSASALPEPKSQLQMFIVLNGDYQQFKSLESAKQKEFLRGVVDTLRLEGNDPYLTLQSVSAGSIRCTLNASESAYRSILKKYSDGTLALLAGFGIVSIGMSATGPVSVITAVIVAFFIFGGLSATVFKKEKPAHPPPAQTAAIGSESDDPAVSLEHRKPRPLVVCTTQGRLEQSLKINLIYCGKNLVKSKALNSLKVSIETHKEAKDSVFSQNFQFISMPDAALLPEEKADFKRCVSKGVDLMYLDPSVSVECNQTKR